MFRESLVVNMLVVRYELAVCCTKNGEFWSHFIDRGGRKVNGLQFDWRRQDDGRTIVSN